MKSMHIAALSVALSAAISAGNVYAAGEQKPATEEKHAHGAGKKHDHEEKKVDVKIPDTADELWAEIDKQHKALAGMVAAKKSEGLHETAETLEALIGAVPAKYPDLAPANKKRVEGAAKNAARVLDELHDEGEEGHWDDASKKAAQVDGVLKMIRTQIKP